MTNHESARISGGPNLAVTPNPVPPPKGPRKGLERAPKGTHSMPLHLDINTTRDGVTVAKFLNKATK